MPEFWAYLMEFIEHLPLTDEDHEKAASFGWEGFTRCASTVEHTSDSDPDVANLDDLEAFDLDEESSPSLSFE
jgi:hypothetical protein